MATNLENAKVILNDENWEPVTELTTDADGNFSFNGIPDGTYYLEYAVWPYSGTAIYAGGAYKSGGVNNMTCDPMTATPINISGGNAVTGINVILKPMPANPGDCVYV